MHPFYAAVFDRFHDLHAEILQAIDSLPAEALDWSPGAEMNSIAVLVTHLAGAERYWVGDVAMGEPSGRDRAAEFEVKGVDAAALKARLEAVEAYLRGALERLTFEELTAEVTSPRNQRKVSVAYALLHPLAHTALHLGHIQLDAQLWQQKGG